MLLFLAMILTGCVESEFKLAKSSILPSWFKVADNVDRDSIEITLKYYTMGSAKLILETKESWFSETITGKAVWHPEYWEWAQRDWPARANPSYMIIDIGGKKEIIEHRKMEPVFYISNEKTVQNIIRGHAN